MEQNKPDPKQLLKQKEEIKKAIESSPQGGNLVSVEAQQQRSLHLSSLEKENYDIQEKKARIAELETRVDGLRQDIEERKRYAWYIFILIVSWFIIILAIVFLSGMGFMEVSDTILVTLITTTTINIAAFFLGVVKYLFPNNGKNSN